MTTDMHRRGDGTALPGLIMLGIAAGLAAPAFADDLPARVRYDGHQVAFVDIETQEQLDFMLTISPDCWCEEISVRPLSFRIPPENMPLLLASGIRYEIVIQDVQVRVDAELARFAEAAQEDGGTWYDDFKTLAAIDQRMDDLAAAHATATVVTLGQSLEGRDIRALHITTGGPDKPGILYNATQHAWLAPMTAMYVAESLLTGYGSDPLITELVDTIEFWVIPVVNPDGYEYAWDVERYWRKNRRPNGGGEFGVDINRNWGYEWGGGGSSGDPGSETYRGTAPFSEPATQVMRDHYAAHPNIVASIDFHTFGEYVLYPWAYTGGGPGDSGEHAIIGNAMDDAIRSVHGHDYLTGPVFDALYQASGGSVDWTWGDQGVYSYTIELRGNDFVIDPSEIIPTGEENLEAALTLADLATLGVTFGFPGGLPTTVQADEPQPISVTITPITSGDLDTASGQLFQRVGGDSFTESALVFVGGNEYDATLAPAPCDTNIEFYFEIDSFSGTTYRSPRTAPESVHTATARDITIVFVDDFESDLSWSVEDIDLTDGNWVAGVPAGDGMRGDPTTDYDGSGSCYLTANREGNSDVDGGPTRLISPLLDASALDDVMVGFAAWFTNDDLDDDALGVDISGDDGATWTPVMTLGATGGWTAFDFRVADYVTPTATMSRPFGATDNPNDSVTEAAIDNVRIFETGCDGGLLGDLDGDGDVDFADLLLALAAWGDCSGCPEDLNGDGVVDFADLLVVLGAWT